MKEIVNISAYKAIDSYHIANRLHESHTKIMGRVGLGNVTSLDTNWIFDENAYFLIAELESTKEIIAGARIQVKSPDNILPMEEALNSMDKNLSDHFSEIDTAEFCGLWISKKFASFGLSCIYMANAIVSLSYTLGIKCLLGICAESTANISKRCGFNFDYSFGDNLMYPKPDLPAYIIAIRDLQHLLKRVFEQKNEIQSLIKNSISKKIIEIKGREIEVNYNLHIPLKESIKKLEYAA